MYSVAILSALFILAYMTWRVFYTIYEDHRCLDERTLRDLAAGRLKKYHRDYADVKRHLAGCEQCQARLREIQHGKPLEDHLLEK
jgi:hypothetical protein